MVTRGAQGELQTVILYACLENLAQRTQYWSVFTFRYDQEKDIGLVISPEHVGDGDRV